MNAGITGNVEITQSVDGVVVHQQIVRNLVVDAGLNLIRNLLAQTSTANVTHFAVGTSATAVSAAQTTIVAEVFRDQITQYIATTNAAAQFKYYLASGDANGNTLREIGLFSAASGGTMMARAILASPIVKNSSTTVTFSWTLNLSAI